MTDLYDTLGVEKSATKDEIRKAYRKKAKKAHPDAGGAAEVFHALTVAHAVLTDDAKREQYDKTGSVEQEPVNDLVVAAEIIGVQLQRLLANDYPGMNLLVEIRVAVENEIRQAEEATKTLDMRIAHLEKRLKQFKVMDDSRDVIGNILRDQIKTHHGHKEHNQRGIELRKMALELLDNYTFEPESMMMSMGNATNATGGWTTFRVR